MKKGQFLLNIDSFNTGGIVTPLFYVNAHYRIFSSVAKPLRTERLYIYNIKQACMTMEWPLFLNGAAHKNKTLN